MRILMTADTVGGVWTYTLDLARALGPDVEVLVATMGAPASEQQRRELATVPNARLAESRFKLEWMDDPWEDVDRAGEWLLGLAAREAPDLVHLNGYAHAALPWEAPVLLVAHSCVCSWWRAVHGTAAPARYDEYRERVAHGLAAAGLVVAPTAAMLAALRREYGVPLANARAILNGRSVPSGDPATKEPFVLSAGRLWDPAKNVRTVVEAARRFDWPAFVAGDLTPPESRDGPACDVSPVHVLGRLGLDALAAWMRRAAVCVLPARYEPFGLTALEAAASGCALVLGDVPTLREIWGEAALYVHPDDVEGLVAAVALLADNPDLRVELATRAQERAAGLTPDSMAAAYRAAYAGLLAPASRYEEDVACAS